MGKAMAQVKLCSTPIPHFPISPVTGTLTAGVNWPTLLHVPFVVNVCGSTSSAPEPPETPDGDDDGDGDCCCG